MHSPSSFLLLVVAVCAVRSSPPSTERMSEKPYVRFTPLTTVREVAVGQKMELNCEAIGVPPPVVSWTFNGQPIVQGPHDQLRNVFEKLPNAGLITVQTGVTGSKLTLPCVDKQHQGAFTCVANNGFATAISNVEVKVEEAEDGPMKCEGSKKEAAPVIYMWTDGRFEREDATVQLYCRASGVPKPDIVWLNEDKQPLVDDATFQTLPSGDLLIRKASWDQMGVYTCVATNEHGEDRQEAFFYPTAATDLNEAAAAAAAVPVTASKRTVKSLWSPKFG